jgi:hypothetical protein
MPITVENLRPDDGLRVVPFEHVCSLDGLSWHVNLNARTLSLKAVDLGESPAWMGIRRDKDGSIALIVPSLDRDHCRILSWGTGGARWAPATKVDLAPPFHSAMID